MLKVKGYMQGDEAKVVDFIRKVQLDVEPDRQILSRSVLIKDNEDIVGMVSYESFDNMGVIRYFLYDARIAGTELVVGMFFELYKQARERGVKRLIAQVPSSEVKVLFEMLGFTSVTGNLSNFAHIVRENDEIMLVNLES